MAAAGKNHVKKKTTKKTAKKASTDRQQRRAAGELNDGDLAAAKLRNPKAFVFQSRGRAQIQKARSAEKDQRRLHGAGSRLLDGPADLDQQVKCCFFGEQ